MDIVNASPDDIATIFDLYDKAIEFQKTDFDKTWLGFDREFVEMEIGEWRLALAVFFASFASFA